ncbi:MAG: insulinase family protein [Gammaproteobacteria bacterium]|nr:insulinase family protein [Gammaproteobacteria bacterium]
MQSFRLFSFLLFFFPFSVGAEEISELILDNGLKVVVKPDHRSPSVAFQTWYKVGSSYEAEGKTGLSHLLEHLMFSASQNPVLGQGFNHLNRVGSNGGAYTGRDDTFYHHILSKEYLPLAFYVESERMKNLSPSNEEFDIEVKVVKEELQTRLSKEPYLKAYNQLYEQAYPGDSYQFPIIGQLEDLNSLTLSETMAWYKKYYTPENTTLVIVGDIDTETTFNLARKYFKSFSQTAAPNLNLNKKLSQKPLLNQKLQPRFVMPETIKLGVVLIAFKVPSIKTSVPLWEAYALEVLAGWFESGDMSRLSRALIREKQVAYDVKVTYSSMQRKDSLFIIEAIPAEGVSVEELEESLLNEISKIKLESISQKNLQKIKTQMIATDIFDRDSLFIQAKIIGRAESIGINWSEDAQYLSRIKAVTVEQLKGVLKKYFVPSKRTIVIQKSSRTFSTGVKKATSN